MSPGVARVRERVARRRLLNGWGAAGMTLSSSCKSAAAGADEAMLAGRVVLVELEFCSGAGVWIAPLVEEGVVVAFRGVEGASCALGWAATILVGVDEGTAMSSRRKACLSSSDREFNPRPNFLIWTPSNAVLSDAVQDRFCLLIRLTAAAYACIRN